MQNQNPIAGPVIVVVAYRPKPGKEKDLLACVKDHIPLLKSRKLVTDRKPIVGRAADGTIVEVFEWKSQDAIGQAHADAEVGKLWQRYAACCDIVKFRDLPEAESLFPGFAAADA